MAGSCDISSIFIYVKGSCRQNRIVNVSSVRNVKIENESRASNFNVLSWSRSSFRYFFFLRINFLCVLAVPSKDISPAVPSLSFEWRSSWGEKQVSSCSLFKLFSSLFSRFGEITAWESDRVGLHAPVHTQHTHMCSTQNGVWLFLNYLNSLWKRGPFVGFLWDCPWKAPIVWWARWYHASAFNRFNGTRGQGSQDRVQAVAFSLCLFVYSLKGGGNGSCIFHVRDNVDVSPSGWANFLLCLNRLVVCSAQALKTYVTISCHTSPVCTTFSSAWPVPPELRWKSELGGGGGLELDVSVVLVLFSLC